MSNILMQIAGQAPLLIVYLLGLVLALVFWRRCPGPAACTLVASVILLLTTIGTTVLTYFIFARMENGRGHESTGLMISIVNIGGNVLRAGAIGLLLTGVFLGRARPAQSPMR